MEDVLEKLNEKQREAVLETEGYVRVIAGAGSGKTKLLVSRYAYLVQDYGIDSANILCVTFTNKAAGEMKRRIRALIGEGNDTTLICTYHGFCNRLLRENPEKLFLNKQFQIIDSAQQKAIIGEIYQKYELKLDYASFEAILRRIAWVKRKTAYVARICNPNPCQIVQEIKDQKDQIVEDFLQRQKATYLLDFHDLIAFAIYVLENYEDVREKWQSRLNYIMVDEFQDSSGVEMHLVEILSEKYKNLMIVGDPDQNIYEWRGSDVRLLVDFDKMHEPTKTIILNQNYRSTPEILKCANTLIEKNKLRLKKDLFTYNAAGSPVTHCHSKNDLEEMDYIIANIKKLRVQEGYRYSDFAILYRSSFLSRIAEKKLVEKNIPYEIFGGVKFYQRMEIMDVLAYLKLIAYDDDTSFRRIINTPRRKFGRAKMNLLDELRAEGSRDGKQIDAMKRINAMEQVQAGEQLDLFAYLDGDSAVEKPSDNPKQLSLTENSLFATLKNNLDEKEFQSSSVAGFVEFVNDIRGRYRGMRISDIVNEVTERSGYEAYIRELGDEERLNNLAEFKRIANEFEREFGENLTLVEFLEQIALQSGEDGEDRKDTVKLMTIHSSKGLEFPVVFILGFTEGIFPSFKTIESRKNEGLEEERRLCYVAMTRARKHLFLMDSEGLSPNGIKKLCSRFIEEIGEDNYIRIGYISDELKKESRGYAAKLNMELELEGTESVKYKSGDRVSHHIFGEGVIQNVDENRGSYIVKFDSLPQPRNISKSYFQKFCENAGKNAETYRALNVRGQVEEHSTSDIGKYAEFHNISEIGRWTEHHNTSNVAGMLPDVTDTLPEDVLGEADFEEENGKENEKEILNFTEDKAEEASLDVIEDDEPEKNTPDIIEEYDGPKNNVLYMAEDDNESEDIHEHISANILEENTFIEEIFSSEESDTIAKLKKLMEKSPNLWKHDEVPHIGWKCVGVDDLGAPAGICEMCGYQIIRYAHHMEHPQYRSLICGCVCAGRMEGDIEGARRREAEFKNRQSRRVRQ